MRLADQKAKIILLFAMITYAIASLSSLICTRANLSYGGLMIGIGFTVFALITHIIASKKHPLLHVVSICFNSLAIGFTIGSYYSVKSVELHIFTPLILLLPFFFLIYLICLLFSKEKRKRLKLFLVILLILVAVIQIIFWSKSDLVSYSFFLNIIALFYVILCRKTLLTPRNILQDISFFSFFIYLIVVYIVLIILTEGDVIDIFSDFSFRRKNKK